MSYMNMGKSMQNEIRELDILFDEFILPKDELWIFGTGKYGKAFYRYLRQCDVVIKGFIVSDEKHKNEQKLPIMTISQFRDYYFQKEKKVGVLLAIDPMHYGNVYPRLMFLKEDLYIVKANWLTCAEKHDCNLDGLNIIIPIIDYCKGIACYGCGVCSPIAQKSKYEFNQFEKDFFMVDKFLHEKVTRINITGGEPFLHPDLLRFVAVLRKTYPTAVISISTNGLSFLTKDDYFWEELGKMNIVIDWTLYPIDYPNMDEFFEKISESKNNQIQFVIHGDEYGDSKSSWLLPYSFEKQKKRDWLFCGHHRDGSNCIDMRDGIIYYCYVNANIKQLEKKFGDKFTESFNESMHDQRNYIKINEIESINQVLKFVKGRHPQCDYCAVRKRRSMGEWMRSKGDFEEWVLNDKERK